MIAASTAARRNNFAQMTVRKAVQHLKSIKNERIGASDSG
jgi:hypothetical protein